MGSTVDHTLQLMQCMNLLLPQQLILQPIRQPLVRDMLPILLLLRRLIEMNIALATTLQQKLAKSPPKRAFLDWNYSDRIENKGGKVACIPQHGTSRRWNSEPPVPGSSPRRGGLWRLGARVGSRCFLRRRAISMLVGLHSYDC